MLFCAHLHPGLVRHTVSAHAAYSFSGFNSITALAMHTLGGQGVVMDTRQSCDLLNCKDPVEHTHNNAGDTLLHMGIADL